MKKVISGVLAATIITTNVPLRVLAEEIPNLGNNDGAIKQEKEKHGYIEVDINLDMPIKYNYDEDKNPNWNSAINVKLSDETKEAKGITLARSGSGDFDYGSASCNYKVIALGAGRKDEAKPGEKIYAYRIFFNNLPAGEGKRYHVNIDGAGFKGMASNIELNDYSQRVIVNNLAYIETNNEENIKDDSSVARMLFGDVNKDGVVDDTDYEMVFNHIGTTDASYDLNRDGSVNITDLTYVHKNMGKETSKSIEANDIDAIVDVTKVDMKAVESDKVENVKIEGTAEDILTDSEDSVKLSKNDNSQINKDNPVAVNLNLTSNESNASKEGVKMEAVRIKGGNSAPSKGSINVIGIDEEGKYINETVDFSNQETRNYLKRTVLEIDNTTQDNSKVNKDIVVDLGKQIAVSEITITITDVTGNDRNLAEIAKIEFLNDVYKEIPKPDMNIPDINKVETSTSAGNESMTVYWTQEENITGYELKVEEIDKEGKTKGKPRVFRMAENSFKVGEIRPYSRYRVSVQSVNGEWEGGYKAPDANDTAGVIDNVTAESIENGKYEPKEFDPDGIVNIISVPDAAPEPPEGIKLVSSYKSLEVSWKDHKSAQSFDVYYKKRDKKEDSENTEKNNVGNNDNTNNEHVTLDGFIKANGNTPITNTTHYIIPNLDDNATYEIKMTASNHKGTSGYSEIYTGTTMDLRIPKTPNYRLINTPKEAADGTELTNTLTNNIKSVTFPNPSAVSITDADCVVDNDYTTIMALSDWDTGVFSGKRGPIIEFDKEYEINRIGVVTRLDADAANPKDALVSYYDNKNNKWVDVRASLHRFTDNGDYTILNLKEPVKSNKIRVNIATPSNIRKVSISELKFYEYDEVEGRIDKLFADDLHLELRKKEGSDEVDVTAEEIAEIENALNTPDKNGEYNPEKEKLEEEVALAKALLAETNISKVMTLDSLITSSTDYTKYGNPWQALGYSAKAGDTIKVYMERSENVTVKLGYEQHYAESGKFINEVTLEPGKNEIKINELTDLDVEKGGNLYARIDNTKDNLTSVVKIRVSGATPIPHLNLNNQLEDVDYLIKNKTNNEDEKVKEIKAELKEYITILDKHIKEMPEKYKEVDEDKNKYAYDEKTSILNSTNIEGDRFTLTLPAMDVYEGITEGKNSIEEQVDRLYDTVLAWEQLIQITNAKKGVFEKVADFDNDGEITQKDYDNPTYKANKASKQRVNVKYQRMFIGAFMYASGHHVGIDVGSSKALMQGVPYKLDENGKVTNPEEGNLFGWGISHEIGHKSDTAGRVYGETSNNILALITQSFDGVDKTRLETSDKYKDIYKRVTSGDIGVSQDIFTLLGMFWQLHLAYENGYTSQMLLKNNDGDVDNDSYWAKLNRAYRANSADIGKIDREQLLIRRASDAAGKDLREFFASWGIIADNNTRIYLQEKFTEEQRETRKIQYLNDEAYRKRLAAKEISDIEMSEETEVEASFKDSENRTKIESGSVINGNSITLDLNVNQSADKILGYEIIRSDGNKLNSSNKTEVNYRPVGFVEAGENGKATFTDNISPINNRAMTYKVIAYDYNLNPTEEVTVGSVKLSHDGTMDSSEFVLKSNLITPVTSNDGTTEKSNTNDDSVIYDNSLDAIKDSKKETVFRGRRMTSDEYNKNPHKQDDIDINADPYIIMDLQGSKNISGLKYVKSENATSRFSLKRLANMIKGETTYSPISNYEIHVSNDSENWEKVAEGTFKFGDNNNSVLGGEVDSDTAKVVFNQNGNLYAHDARYVKLVAKGAGNSGLDIADISLIGSTGDNIEIGAIDKDSQNKTNGIGRLEEDFAYDSTDSSKKIPAGSIVVTGDYKGNPAFNVPLLIDENNNTIGGKAILMANVPENAPLGSVESGKWVYWIEKENFDKLTTKVKAELYRYNELAGDDGKTPIGQRLVSDTLYTSVNAETYENLPSIKLENAGTAKSKAYNSIKFIDTKDFRRQEN